MAEEIYTIFIAELIKVEEVVFIILILYKFNIYIEMALIK